MSSFFSSVVVLKKFLLFNGSMSSTERKYGKLMAPEAEATYKGTLQHRPAPAQSGLNVHGGMSCGHRGVLICAVALVALAMVRATRRHLPGTLLVVVMCAMLRYASPWMAVITGIAAARVWEATMGGQQFSTLGLAIGIVVASVL